MSERRLSHMTPIGEAVGEGVSIVLYKIDGIIYELIPIAEASRLHLKSKSNLRLRADIGQLIAHKRSNRWYVERNLSKPNRKRLDRRARNVP